MTNDTQKMPDTSRKVNDLILLIGKFVRGKITGSITIHFSQGGISKVVKQEQV
jgi:hypothetical protein